ADIIRRHRLAERLFTDSLAMDSETEIEQQACKFEHILSPEATDKICAFLGHPRTCPHGAPIPPGPCCGRQAGFVSTAVDRTKSAETVTKYAVGACEYLHSHGTDLLVIACNTATALALPKIERVVGVGVVGVIEPGAQSASGASQNRKVVVIGTDATISSHAYLRALKSRGVEAREKACPLLVPLVEEGWIAHPVTEQVARIYLDEAFAGEFESADVLVLGCTHYPLLKPI